MATIRRTLTDGPDNYVGTNADELIFGLNGRDQIDGAGGNDTIIGGGDNDDLRGSDGNDRLEGGARHDRLTGGFGDDLLLGQDGNDNLDGGFGNDRLRGSYGNDVMAAQHGNDFLYGGQGNDRLSAVLDDFLGQESYALLSGGAGKDNFEVLAAADGARDVVEIVDFNQGDAFLTVQIGSSSTHDSARTILDGATGRSVTGPFFAPLDTLNPTIVGHDLLLTFNGADQDQVIIKGGADWMHI